MLKLTKKVLSLILIILLIPAGQCFAEEVQPEQNAENVQKTEIVIVESDSSDQEKVFPAEMTEDGAGPAIEPEPEETDDDFPTDPVDAKKDDPLIQTGASAAGGQTSETNSENTLPENIWIQDISVGQSPANNKYSYISFFFSDTDGSRQYECYITGLEIDPSCAYSESTADSYKKLCTDIAKNFYLQKSFRISDDEEFKKEYNLSFRPIDAEKQNAYLKATVEAPEADKDNDSALCWASSTSDMFIFSGWADKAKQDGKLAADANEDTVFTYLKEKFYNTGLYASEGLKYLFSGENRAQDVKNNQEMQYEFNPNRAQLRDGSDDSVQSAGMLREYVYESVSQTKKNGGDGVVDTNDSFAADIQELKTGAAVGVGHDGHAETLFGYIIDTLKTGFESVKALFLADSDNDSYDVPDLPQDYKDKKFLPNSYTMTAKIADPEDPNYDGYFNLTNWVVLKPYSESVEKENTASYTKNAKNTADISVDPVSVKSDGSRTFVTSTAEKGSTIKLVLSCQNASYAGLDSSLSPRIKGEVTVMLNGKSEVTIPVDYSISSDQCCPNAVYYIEGVSYTVTSCGEYSFTFTADGIYYSNGEKIPEAYWKNNTSPRACTVTVSDNPNEIISGQSERNSVMHVHFSKIQNNPYKIIFNAPISDFGRLSIDGRTVESGSYSLSLSDNGEYVLTLSEKLIAGLDNGTYAFLLSSSDESRHIVFYVTISD